ncbi:MAG: class I SAM-dependent methyltransferase [Thomasclavelia sp.]
MSNKMAFEALEYDDKINKTVPYYQDFFIQTINLIKIYLNKPITWLDIGCGTGKMAEVAFKNTEIDQFVFCDSSKEMIEIVKERFQRNNSAFITKSVFDLSYENQFDVVTSILVFHAFTYENRIKAIKKCYQALKKDGIFITFENFAPFTSQGTELFLKRWRAYQFKQGKSLEECNKHIARYNQNYFPISIFEHIEIIKQCGFKTVEIFWLSNMQVGLMAIK